MKFEEISKFLEFPGQHFDGHLVLSSSKINWTLTVIQKQLLYAVDELHAARRWKRLLKKYAPAWNWHADFAQTTESHQSWQLYLLNVGMERQLLSPVRAKLLIRQIAQECLFELYGDKNVQSIWKPLSVSIAPACKSILLSRLEMQMTLGKVNNMRQQWQDAGLEALTPSLSPVLRQHDNEEIFNLDRRYLDGSFTIWEIAGQLEKSIIEVAQSLFSLAEKGALEFQNIPDVPLPSGQPVTAHTHTTQPSTEATVSQPASPPQPSLPRDQPPSPTGATASPAASPPHATSPHGQKPLIACIDDSPVLAYSLKKILVSAGYRALIIQEPMRGFSQLIEHRPSLILLDLMLPNADGYSVCKFLRDTPIFEATPIIILTGKNKPIDRARARLVGATEFITKPPKPDHLLKMIREHLGVHLSV
ncbi:MAG: response regulator [Elainellaceae cyanobacterium]